MRFLLLLAIIFSTPAYSQYSYDEGNSNDSQAQAVFQGVDQKILKKISPYRQIIDFSHYDPVTQQDSPFPTNPIYAYDYVGNVSRNGDTYYLWEDNTKINRNGTRIRQTIETPYPNLPTYQGKTYKSFQEWLNVKFYVEPSMQKAFVFNPNNLEIMDYTNIDWNTGIRYNNRYFPIYSYVYYGTYTNNGIRKYAWLKARPNFNGKQIYELVYTSDKKIPKHTLTKVYKNYAEWYYEKFGTNR
jgi:hypothetical protein